jgi:hypothetical protein
MLLRSKGIVKILTVLFEKQKQKVKYREIRHMSGTSSCVSVSFFGHI